MINFERLDPEELAPPLAPRFAIGSCRALPSNGSPAELFPQQTPASIGLSYGDVQEAMHVTLLTLSQHMRPRRLRASKTRLFDAVTLSKLVSATVQFVRARSRLRRPFSSPFPPSHFLLNIPALGKKDFEEEHRYRRAFGISTGSGLCFHSKLGSRVRGYKRANISLSTLGLAQSRNNLHCSVDRCARLPCFLMCHLRLPRPITSAPQGRIRTAGPRALRLSLRLLKRPAVPPRRHRQRHEWHLRPLHDFALGYQSGGYITYQAYPGHHPTILKNGNLWDGIQFWNTTTGPSYIIIDGFIVVGNAQSITASQAQSAADNNNTTNGNCIGAGSSSHHIVIRNNKVSYCPGGGIVFTGDYIQIYRNIIHHNSFWSPYDTSGITVQGTNSDKSTATKIFVYDNVLYNNQNYICNKYQTNPCQITDGEGIIVDSNISAGYSGRIAILNNITYNNGGPRITVSGSQHVIYTITPPT